jgi:hypothetical protein
MERTVTWVAVFRKEKAMILISGESFSESGAGGSESPDVVTDRMQLVMPPKLELAQVFGAALYSAKAVLAGRATYGSV